MHPSSVLVTVGLVLIASACQAQQVTTAEEASNAIRGLSQRTYSDAFVIFEARPSGQYVQFFNGGNAVYFDFTVQSASRKGIPDALRMGEVQEAPPTLSGEIASHRFISSEQTERLREALRRHGLTDVPAYQVGFAPDESLGGWFEIIRGEYTLDPDQTLAFLHDVFGEAYGLKEYSIHMEEN